MSKTNSSPTFGWVAASHVYRVLALTFLFVLLIIFIAGWTIRYSLEKDCQDYYKRDISVLGYWIHVESGSNKNDCPRPFK